MEQIAINQASLLQSVLPEATDFGHSLRDPALTKRMQAGGMALLSILGTGGIDTAANWTSDTARGWGAMAVGIVPDLTIGDRLSIARRFAKDDHFSVREWAWIAVRRAIIADLDAALDVLQFWSIDQDPLVRRFASEATRPRGVWCPHIIRLKEDPELAANILESLHLDEARYVQLSVGNWLNDAARSRPTWVIDLCDRWQEADDGRVPDLIVRRALRSLRS